MFVLLVTGCAGEKTQRDANEVARLADERHNLWTRFRKLPNDAGRKRRREFILMAARTGHYLFQLNYSMQTWKPRVQAYWQLQAARQGNTTGQFLTGANYFEGRGVPKDHRSAFYWMRRAAYQGHTTAQAFLSLYYRQGVGTAPDRAFARKWLLAARYTYRGHLKRYEPPGAIPFKLAEAHLCGRGAPVDLATSRRLLSEAARAGHAHAQAVLRERLDEAAVRKRVCKNWHRVGQKKASRI